MNNATAKPWIIIAVEFKNAVKQYIANGGCVNEIAIGVRYNDEEAQAEADRLVGLYPDCKGKIMKYSPETDISLIIA